ncbi:hypothetical protein ACJJTC_018189 [Scirpophaga incertulas]
MHFFPTDGNDGVGNNNNHGNTNSDQAFINRVSIRTPPFCKDRPTLWFSSLEAQFHINGITQEVTKYHFAISHLDMECIREVEDIIIQPPQTEPYSKLKNAIISRFSESYEEKVRRLLESEPIGDRKPSSFLRHLRSLAGPCFPEQLLKTIWLNRLPRHVQLILASRKEQTLEDLWDLADQLMEITSHTPPAPVTFEVSSSQAAAPTAADFQALNRKVEELTRAVAALTAAGPSGGAHHFHCHGTSRRQADFAALAQSQQDDEELAEIRNSSSLKLEEIPIPGTNTNLLCDTSSGRPRPYLTPPFRRAAFDPPHPATLPASATTPLADPVITSPSSSAFPFAAHQPSTTLTSTSSFPTSPPLGPHPVITRAGRRVKFRDILDL